MKLLIPLLFPFILFADFVPDEVLVKFKEKGAISVMEDVQSIECLFDNIYKLKFKKDTKIFDVIDKLKKNPDVIYAEPNYIRRICAFPNDPKTPSQWALSKIEAFRGWDIGTGSSDVIIAILDTGIDYTHEDLSSKIAGSMSFVIDEPDPMDRNGHGTHVSGIAAGATDNGIGIAGLAWNCKILAIKCLDSEGAGYDDEIAKAIKYAADKGAKVINMSFGGSKNGNTMKEACDYAYNKGVFLVAACGNDGTQEIFYPAGYNNVMAVSATNQSDQKAYFSNYGDWVDIAAPGVNILSTIIPKYGTYASMSGTSMAAPFVSGLAGLLFSRYPGATNTFVFNRIRECSDRVDFEINGGRINSYYALSGENRAPLPFSIIQPKNDGFTSSIYPTFRWSPSVDPDFGDCITYSLFLSCEGNLSTITTRDTFWIPNFNEPLLQNKKYGWWVIASDSRGSKTISDTSTFTTTPIIIAYPNPAKFGEVVKFRGIPLSYKEVSISIYTIAGELVERLPGGGGKEVNWDTKNIASGVYIYIISNQDQVFATSKIGVIK